MSAKLVVKKIESGIQVQYLCVTIDDDDNCCSFSDWSNYQNKLPKKETDKSRLVVKMTTELEDKFNLDSCAYELINSDNASSKDQNNANYSQVKDLTTEKNVINIPNSKGSENVLGPEMTKIDFENSIEKSSMPNNPSEWNSSDYFHRLETLPSADTAQSSDAQDQAVSPLEYSLRKVKKNNAKIMENIEMLNRTLNYTKKNEILNMACSKSLRSYPCTLCGKCFVYETGLKRHYSMRHSLTEIQPRWQTVWTCIECFQVWPRQDFALRHATQCYSSENGVREIKTSSLLQCEFCEKVFTSIPRLLRHSKMHTTASNYECNACELNFWSYKAAEQHRAKCPWQTICYKFSLPKLLLCNACDRKFRTYEQLYNHRYLLRYIGRIATYLVSKRQIKL